MTCATKICLIIRVTSRQPYINTLCSESWLELQYSQSHKVQSRSYDRCHPTNSTLVPEIPPPRTSIDCHYAVIFNSGWQQYSLVDTGRASDEDHLSSAFFHRYSRPSSNMSSAQTHLGHKRDFDIQPGCFEKHPLRALRTSLPCRSRWYRHELPHAVCSRCPLYVTKFVCDREGYYSI